MFIMYLLKCSKLDEMKMKCRFLSFPLHILFMCFGVAVLILAYFVPIE